jgi:hypothetical protein
VQRRQLASARETIECDCVCEFCALLISSRWLFCLRCVMRACVRASHFDANEVCQFERVEIIDFALSNLKIVHTSLNSKSDNALSASHTRRNEQSLCIKLTNAALQYYVFVLGFFAAGASSTSANASRHGTHLPRYERNLARNQAVQQTRIASAMLRLSPWRNAQNRPLVHLQITTYSNQVG